MNGRTNYWYEILARLWMAAFLLNNLFCPDPLKAQDGDAQVGGGWVGPGPAGQTLLSRFSGSNSGMSWSWIAEARAAVRPQHNRARAGGRSHLRAFVSGQLESSAVTLWAGRRFTPGESSFLEAAQPLPRLPGLPSEKRRGLLAGAWGGKSALLQPGLIGLEGLPGAGILLRSSLGCGLLLHGSARLGAAFCQIRQPVGAYEMRLLLDATLEPDIHSNDTEGRRLAQGYAGFHLREKQKTVLRIRAFRRNSWDRTDDGNSRRGRSGAADILARPFDFLHLRAAGRDLGQVGQRVASFRLEQANWSISPVLRARAYSFARYGSNKQSTFESEETPARSHDRGAAAGLRWLRQKGQLALMAEARRFGKPSVELCIQQNIGGTAIRGSVLARKRSEQPYVQFVETGAFREGGPTFYHDAERIFKLEVRSASLALSISLTQSAGRPRQFGAVQFIWPLWRQAPRRLHRKPRTKATYDNAESVGSKTPQGRTQRKRR